jgi:hypothetical protein
MSSKLLYNWIKKKKPYGCRPTKNALFEDLEVCFQKMKIIQCDMYKKNKILYSASASDNFKTQL